MANNSRFEKLTRDNVNDTIICAGHSSFTVKQLEDEIDYNTEIGKKLKTIEQKLEEEY